MNLTTDFGQLEQVIQGKIDRNRGKARVAAAGLELTPLNSLGAGRELV